MVHSTYGGVASMESVGVTVDRRVRLALVSRVASAKRLRPRRALRAPGQLDGGVDQDAVVRFDGRD